MDALNIPEIAVNSIIGCVQEGYQLVLNNDVTIYDEPQKEMLHPFSHTTQQLAIVKI